MNRFGLRPWRFPILPAVLAATACGESVTGAPEAEALAAAAPEARAFLTSVVDLMEAHSLRRFSIDWTAFRASVFAAGATARMIPDTYAAIELALTLIGDGHSSLRTADGLVIFAPTQTCIAAPAGTPDLPDDVGYVRVGAFSGQGDEAVAFATAIQDRIRAADRAGLAGWVVDLRGNTGGNMWPMLAGLGPILGEGVIGHFIDPGGVAEVWEYEDGASRLDGSTQVRVNDPYRLLRSRPRVAVLVDHAVASSGEAAAIAFVGRLDTRFFGTPTCGLSTANRAFPLSDGSTLILTVSVMADRDRNAYGRRVGVDEHIGGVESDEVARLAAVWVESVRLGGR